MDQLRTQPVLDPKLVASKKLLFLGAGSLGSLIVSNLAYPWREIVIVDYDSLKPENLERHLLGKDALGLHKVQGVAKWLVNKGVDTPITSHAARAQDVFAQHTDADLVIVSIDDQFTLCDIDEWCADNNIPALYGGIYPKGVGGEVIVITDSNDICYQCAAHMMGRSINQGSIPNYSLGTTVFVGREPPPIPALHRAISSTAADVAGLALEILSGANLERQILVHMHSSLEPIINIVNSRELKVLANYIDVQSDLGFIPNLSIEKTEKSYQLKAKHSVFSLSLKRWDKCTFHPN